MRPIHVVCVMAYVCIDVYVSHDVSETYRCCSFRMLFARCVCRSLLLGCSPHTLAKPFLRPPWLHKHIEQ